MKRSTFQVLCGAALAGVAGVAGAALSTNDPNSNLIYVPVQQCRLIDTRLSSGGNLVAGVAQSFLAYGAVASQGGKAAGCPHPKETGGPEPVAMSANITAVGALASGDGNIKAYAAGGSSASALSLVNYRQGTNLANAAMVPLCSGGSCPGGKQLSLLSGLSNIPAVVDVLGYFYPRATNVVTVAKDGGDFTDPRLAMNWLATVASPAPSASNPWVMEIGPGTYQLAATPLNLSLPGVTVRGAGPGVTILNGQGGGSAKTGTVIISAGDTALEQLSVTTTAGTKADRYAISIALPTGSAGQGPIISQVHATASLGATSNTGLDIDNDVSTAVSISQSQLRGVGGATAIGLSGHNGSAAMKSFSVAHAEEGTTATRGGVVTTGFVLNTADSELSAVATTDTIDGLFASGSGTTVTAAQTDFSADGSLSSTGVNGVRLSTGAILQADRSVLDGDIRSILADAPSSAKIGSSQLSGSASGAALTCVVSWSGASFTALGAGCN